MNLENSITHAVQWTLVLLVAAAAWGVLVYARRIVLARLGTCGGSIALVRCFEREGIEFAYPTQTVHLGRAAALPA
ncbi:MAG: hypothetical protein HONDAALG_02201 [Gammaproteobacteria bacterium]|nr:hypothetical protein [Gammaproteobacteria bacterium]